MESVRLGRFMERSCVLPTTQIAYRNGLVTCDILLCLSQTLQNALDFPTPSNRGYREEEHWDMNKSPAVLRGSAARRRISTPMCDQSTECNPHWHIRFWNFFFRTFISLLVSLWNSMVWDWRVSTAGPMLFYWPICSLPICLLLFSLSLLSFYGLVLWGWGLRTDRVLIALSQPCSANIY